MNGAVSEAQFTGFSLRLRTASSGSYVLPPIYSNAYSVAEGEVTFTLTASHAKALNEGQYYKIQLAYCATQEKDETGKVNGKEIGYYSTVGVAKCVSKPEVSIRNLVFENINAFNNEYFGLYDLTNCKDRTEKVYSYEFKIYDEQDNVFYTSGEKLHQAYYDVDYTSSLDRITINDFTSNDTVYSIEYTVTTLNGLIISSPKYKISSQYLVAPSNNIHILPQADWEHGVIDIHFEGETDPAHSYYYILDEDLLNSLEVDDNGQPVIDDSNQTMVSKIKEVLYYYKDNDKLVYLRNNSLYKFYRFNTNTYHYQFLNNRLTNMVEVNGKYYYKSDVQTYLEMGIDIPDEALVALDYYEKIISGKNLLKSLTYEYVEYNFIDLSKEYVISTSEHEQKYFGSYLLSRASDEDDYRTWFNIARFRLDDQIPSDIIIRDVTIEHGRKYKYALQQYNIWGLASARIVSDIFEASFEDVFLYDGERSLRVRYNPAIDTFKTTILEQKTDTIGGKYPFITRNGATWYKEFPLGGLLAQEIDDMHYFVDPHYGDAHRHATSDKDDKTPDNAFLNYHDYSDTVIALERDFKLQVLDWLNDGKPKLFKSPYEGNYIIRLMNVSLTPVKELGRMLHSFTSQAYEIAECTYDNLVAFGFIKPTSPSDLIGLWKTYDLSDPSLRDENGDVIIEFEHGVQSFTIQDLMPGDIIYLTFSNQDEELPIMIGITGSYTYEGISDDLVKIRIPQPEDHDLMGKIDAFYTGMRITDFDAIINMQLKTIVSQQYVGTSPWMQKLKIGDWLAINNYNQYWKALEAGQYNELQNYNFRTYLDQVVSPNGDGSYSHTETFAKLAWSLDPGELLDRINLTINKGKKFKTELLQMEMMRFRERPLIPVFTETPRVPNLYVPGEFKSLLEEKPRESSAVDLLVATTPFGYPHPIEELQEYEMLDPFCIYQVFYYDNTLDDWIPYPGSGDNTCYYDPYYRSWMAEEYDPTVKMDYEWVQVAYLEDQIIGYCNEAQLENFKNFNVSITGKYWAGENEDIKFNLSQATIDALRAEPNEVTGYIIPIYSYTADSQYLVERNRIHQANKKKKERGEYIDQPINEKEMFDYRLRESWNDNGQRHYQYSTKKGNYDINSNKVTQELYDKVNDDQYLVIGALKVQPNTVYWVKQYKVQLNMTTEKVIEYKNIDLMNSYHIGNGVVAELTFQLRIIDYYTEIYDNDVRIAKENYLNAKQFYSQLMKTYNIIAKASLNMNVNHGFMELYDRLLKGNKLNEHLDENDEITIKNTLNQSGSKEDLKLQSLYRITMINTAFSRTILDLLIKYKSKYEVEDWDIAFQNAEIYHCYKSTANSEIEINDIIDGRNFDDNTNIFYIRDDRTDELAITEENMVTYRYLYQDGNTYYYQVNKEAYLDDYMSSHSTADRDELIVLYVPKATENEEKFIVISEDEFLRNGTELYELERIIEPVTTKYLDLLNIDEVAALKLEDYFISLYPEFTDLGLPLQYCSHIDFIKCYENYKINPPFKYYVSGKLSPEDEYGIGFGISEDAFSDINIYDVRQNTDDAVVLLTECSLYEETEINNILNGEMFEGVIEKNKNLNDEIDLINKDINDSQSAVDSLKLTYINAYAKMMTSIKTYNIAVYQDWCARILKDMFNKEDDFYPRLYGNGQTKFIQVPVGADEEIKPDTTLTQFTRIGYCSTADYQNNLLNNYILNEIAYIADGHYLNKNIIDLIVPEKKTGVFDVEVCCVDYYEKTAGGDYYPTTDTSFSAQKEYYRFYNNIDYLKEWLPREGMSESYILTALAEQSKEAAGNSTIEIIEEEQVIKNLIYAINGLYDSIKTNLPKVQIYQRMIIDNSGDIRLDTYLQEQISAQTGQIVLEFYAMYEGLRQLIDKLKEDTTGFFEQPTQQEYVSECSNLIDKYHELYEQLIKNRNFDMLSTDVPGYADVTSFIINLKQQYSELYSNQLVEALQNNSSSIAFNMIDIASLSRYQNDEKFLSKSIKNIHNDIELQYWNYNISAETQAQILQVQAQAQEAIQMLQPEDFNTTDEYLAAIQVIQDRLKQQMDALTLISTEKTVLGLNQNATQVADGIELRTEEEENNFWYDPITADKSYNIFYDTIAGWSVSDKQRFSGENYKNIAIYFYRSSFNLENEDEEEEEQNDDEEEENQEEYKQRTGSPIPYFIFNPLDKHQLDPTLISLGKNNNYAIFNTLTAGQKNNVLKLNAELSDLLTTLYTSITGNNSTAWISYLNSYNYIKDPSKPGESLYTRRAVLIGLLEKLQADTSIKVVDDLLQAAQNYLITFYANDGGENYYLPTVSNKAIGNILFEVQLDTQIGGEYHVPYKTIIINGETAPALVVDNNGSNYYKPIMLRKDGGNWYQPIYLDEQMLLENTKVMLDEKMTTGELDEIGLYYEYLKTYLDKIEEKNKLLQEAQELARLYQKQLDVYTEKYNKYYDDYMTNQEIYSSYFGTEAFNYYNLLNGSSDEEVKNAAIQSKKAAAQEAWWKFLNLLDARYSAEKERGMYV